MLWGIPRTGLPDGNRGITFVRPGLWRLCGLLGYHGQRTAAAQIGD